MDGRAAVSTLAMLGAICALIPVEGQPYSALASAMIRCILAVLACGLMVAGSRFAPSRVTHRCSVALRRQSTSDLVRLPDMAPRMPIED